MSWKQTVKQYLPAPLLKRLQHANRRLWLMRHPDARAEHHAMRQLKREFDERNRSAARGEIILRPGVQFFSHPSGLETFSSFFLTPRAINEMDGFLAETAGRKCLFDIGAFQGIFSLVFCSGGSRSAYAFEPSPPAFEVLKYNATANPTLNIHPQQMAIGDAPGELQMNFEWQHLVATRPDAGGTAPAGSVRVPVTTMTAFCAANHIEPDTIKIDVEGFEYQVLQGAADVLRRARPLMYIEIHPIFLAQYGVSLSSIWDLLKSLDYSILDIHRQPLTDPTPFAAINVFNIVCRPSESASEGR